MSLRLSYVYQAALLIPRKALDSWNRLSFQLSSAWLKTTHSHLALSWCWKPMTASWDRYCRIPFL